MLFDFNMCALTALLRRQSEQNPSASYFNVDILKYQVCDLSFSFDLRQYEICCYSVRKSHKYHKKHTFSLRTSTSSYLVTAVVQVWPVMRTIL
jgi:hypothetical protein